jgi:uncharacterized integral membrane protein
MNLRLVLAWAVGIALLVFVAQNFETAQVSVLLWTIEMPRAVMIILAFAAGGFLGWLIPTLRRPEDKEKTNER